MPSDTPQKEVVPFGPPVALLKANQQARVAGDAEKAKANEGAKRCSAVLTEIFGEARVQRYQRELGSLILSMARGAMPPSQMARFQQRKEQFAKAQQTPAKPEAAA